LFQISRGGTLHFNFEDGEDIFGERQAPADIHLWGDGKRKLIHLMPIRKDFNDKIFQSVETFE
jgi:hypothetical protein